MRPVLNEEEGCQRRSEAGRAAHMRVQTRRSGRAPKCKLLNRVYRESTAPLRKLLPGIICTADELEGFDRSQLETKAAVNSGRTRAGAGNFF